MNGWNFPNAEDSKTLSVVGAKVPHGARAWQLDRVPWCSGFAQPRSGIRHVWQDSVDAHWNPECLPARQTGTGCALHVRGRAPA